MEQYIVNISHCFDNCCNECKSYLKYYVVYKCGDYVCQSCYEFYAPYNKCPVCDKQIIIETDSKTCDIVLGKIQNVVVGCSKCGLKMTYGKFNIHYMDCVINKKKTPQCFEDLNLISMPKPSVILKSLILINKGVFFD
jgi:hypothetical protein